MRLPAFPVPAPEDHDVILQYGPNIPMNERFENRLHDEVVHITGQPAQLQKDLSKEAGVNVVCDFLMDGSRFLGYTTQSRLIHGQFVSRRIWFEIHEDDAKKMVVATITRKVRDRMRQIVLGQRLLHLAQ